MKIKILEVIDSIYEDIEVDLEELDFLKAIESSKYIKIIDKNNEIWINSDYIISFSFN